MMEWHERHTEMHNHLIEMNQQHLEYHETLTRNLQRLKRMQMIVFVFASIACGAALITAALTLLKAYHG